jgi:hypothetical protein
MVMYMRADVNAQDPSQADILWAALDRVTKRIAWELPQYQALSQYLTLAQGAGGNSSSIASRAWPFSYFSPEVERKVVSGGLTNRGWAWDPWGMVS